jgi:heat shock protein HslJ
MKKILILGLLMILVLAACASGEGSPSIEGQWALVSYGPVSGQISAMTDVETNIEFTNGQMGGNVGCNGFGGEYTVEGGTIAFGPVMSTMMFCEEIAEQESGTLAVFQESAKFVLDGDKLTITSADGASMIVLERK